MSYFRQISPSPHLTPPDIICAQTKAGACSSFHFLNRRIDLLYAARPEGTPRKHKISAAARRRMAIAQRKRWAKIRGESEPPAPAKAPKAKRRISEEGMKRIIAATKKRWRLQKAAAKAPAKSGIAT